MKLKSKVRSKSKNVSSNPENKKVQKPTIHVPFCIHTHKTLTEYNKDLWQQKTEILHIKPKNKVKKPKRRAQIPFIFKTSQNKMYSNSVLIPTNCMTISENIKDDEFDMAFQNNNSDIKTEIFENKQKREIQRAKSFIPYDFLTKRNSSLVRNNIPRESKAIPFKSYLEKLPINTPKSSVNPLNIQNAFKDEQIIIKEGYLWKKSKGILAKWKVKYCKLTEGAFRYYNNRNSSKLKGCLHFRLLSCTISIGENPFSFTYFLGYLFF